MIRIGKLIARLALVVGHLRLPLVIATVGFVLLSGCDSDETPTSIRETTVPSIITTFSDRSAFVSAIPPINPLDAPFSGDTDTVVVGDGLFSIRPGGSVTRIAVANVIYDSLPSDLMVDCHCYSNLDVAFNGLISGFGFGVESWTATNYEGASDFVVILYDEGAAVGSGRFSTPALGYSFFALLSTVKFDALTLRETGGGPQEGPSGYGGVDREAFGTFYVVP